MLSQHRNTAAARRFFKRAIASHGVPDRVVIDKNVANLANLNSTNAILKFVNMGNRINVLKVKDLDKIREHDHRFVKRITEPMQGFNSFHSAQVTLAGIETAHMIRKGQLGDNSLRSAQQFAALVA